jgi:hypothetical protein
MAKQSKKEAKFNKVMNEYSHRKLHSGSSHGPIVRDRDRALAIAFKVSGLSRKK